MYAEKYQQISEIAASLCLLENHNYTALCAFCGERKMSILRGGGQIKFQCFRASCGKRGVLNDRRSIEDVRGILVNRTKPRVQNHSDLPRFQTAVENTPEGSELLLRMGAEAAYERGLCKITFAPRENRVLIYTRSEKGAVGRSVSGQPPKWMTYGDCSEGIEVGSGPTVVIVEDAFSACAVGQLDNYTGFALLGTKFKPKYNLVLKKYNRAVICLDKDASRVAFSITKEINVPSTMRFLKRDLKHCTPDEIQKILS